MRAIKIDPEHCTVQAIEVEPTEIAGTLGTGSIETIEFDKKHCLVINDADHATAHPARFHFTKGPRRPFFGAALILGMTEGNWSAASLDPEGVRASMVWEEWDNSTQQYAVLAVSGK